jgi:hypothetical protein
MLWTIYGALMVPKLAATRRNEENIEEKLMSISGIEPGTIGSAAQHSPTYTIRAPIIIIFGGLKKKKRFFEFLGSDLQIYLRRC